jgi:hypothetical protein
MLDGERNAESFILDRNVVFLIHETTKALTSWKNKAGGSREVV